MVTPQDFYHTVTSLPDTAQRNALLREIQVHPGCEEYTPHQLRVYFKTKRKEEGRAARAASEAEKSTTTLPVKQRFERVPTSHQHNGRGKTLGHPGTRRRVSETPVCTSEKPAALISGGLDEYSSTTDVCLTNPERPVPRSTSTGSDSFEGGCPHLAELPSTDSGISHDLPVSGEEVRESASVVSYASLNTDEIVSTHLAGSDGAPVPPDLVPEHVELASMLQNVLREPSTHASERPKTFKELSQWIEEERRRALLPPLSVLPKIWCSSSGP